MAAAGVYKHHGAQRAGDMACRQLDAVDDADSCSAMTGGLQATLSLLSRQRRNFGRVMRSAAAANTGSVLFSSIVVFPVRQRQQDHPARVGKR
ncbi:hypothetical protein [Mesorhizobium silamurunense]|uniref:hypothetical protein n=1 Tax=Mesorhizobium silamurunense TaxID=499528 RepID=UPI001FE5978C|nr:hypothetical protein [Mesorhizobium silamurunense]